MTTFTRSSRHLVDPQLQPMLEVLPTFDVSAESLSAIRLQIGVMSSLAADLPVMPVVKIIDGPAEPVELYCFDPAPGEIDRPVCSISTVVEWSRVLLGKCCKARQTFRSV